MNVAKTALEQAWELQDNDQQTVEDPQAYADELVAIMTEVLDQKHPRPIKINNAAYTEDLTASGRPVPTLTCAGTAVPGLVTSTHDHHRAQTCPWHRFVGREVRSGLSTARSLTRGNPGEPDTRPADQHALPKPRPTPRPEHHKP